MSLKEFPVEKEYGKNAGISAEDIKKLREWLKTQRHLPEKYITDLDLILIYHSCDHSPEISKQVLDLHYTLRTCLPFFQEIQFNDNLERTLRSAVLTQLPTVKEGSTVLYGRLIDTNPNDFTIVTMFRIFVMMMEMWQYEQGTWSGIIIVIDMKGVSLAHLTRLDVGVVQQFLYFLQEALLAKLKAVHIVNVPYFMDKIMMIIKPFMKQSLLKLLHLHQTDEIDGLPNLSGLPVDAIIDETIEKIKTNQDFFKEQCKKIVDETKREGKPKTINEIFGTEGSFKKLDID